MEVKLFFFYTQSTIEETNWLFFLHPVNYDGYVRANCMLKWTLLLFYWIIQACMLFAGVWQCTDSSSGQPVFGGTESFPGWRHHERPCWTVWSQVGLVQLQFFYWLRKKVLASSVQFTWRWYLCAWKSPYALHPIPHKFPQRHLWDCFSQEVLLEPLFKNFVENCITCVTHSSGLRHCQVSHSLSICVYWGTLGLNHGVTQ